MKTVGLISLGCDKNRVDAEKMLSKLVKSGYGLVDDYKTADVIIVNTCAFIDDAKKETIDAIFDAVAVKREKDVKVVVTGCFSTRYGEEGKQGIPEVDDFVAVADEDGIVDRVNALFGEKTETPYSCGRVLTTPPWYAYLKISDGCNNRCSYCAIPSIRGKYVSTPIETLVEEGKALSEQGVKELIVVAQDTTNYGKDIYGQTEIVRLLKELCKLDFWKIRLLYAYPESVTKELLDFIASEKKMAKYLDVPMQHISNDVLKKMCRRSDSESIIRLMQDVRNMDEYIAIRSSFIVGFPSETDLDSARLNEFVEKYVDYAGFFVFSPEEGTKAYGYTDKVPLKIARKRKAQAEKAWQKGYLIKQERLLNEIVEVICDGIDEDKGMFFGRTEYQTPDADTKVYFTADYIVNQGDVYKVKIVKTGFDLIGVSQREWQNEIQA